MLTLFIIIIIERIVPVCILESLIYFVPSLRDCIILNAILFLSLFNRVKNWLQLLLTQGGQVSLSLVAVNSVQLLVPLYFIFIFLTWNNATHVR